MFTRRQFLGSSAAAMIRRTRYACVRLSRRSVASAARPRPVRLPPSIAALTSMRDQARADHQRRAARAHRKGAPADGAAQDRRADADRRHVARLLHQHPLGRQRAAVRRASSRPRASRSSSAPRSRRIARASRSRSARSAAARPTSAPGRKTRARSCAVAQGLKDRGIATGRLGVEETIKFVLRDSVADAAPQLKVVSATPIIAGCRMIKDAHEIELMRLACQATLKVLRSGLPRARSRA